MRQTRHCQLLSVCKTNTIYFQIRNYTVSLYIITLVRFGLLKIIQCFVQTVLAKKWITHFKDFANVFTFIVLMYSIKMSRPYMKYWNWANYPKHFKILFDVYMYHHNLSTSVKTQFNSARHLIFGLYCAQVALTSHLLWTEAEVLALTTSATPSCRSSARWRLSCLCRHRSISWALCCLVTREMSSSISTPPPMTPVWTERSMPLFTRARTQTPLEVGWKCTGIVAVRCVTSRHCGYTNWWR